MEDRLLAGFEMRCELEPILQQVQDHHGHRRGRRARRWFRAYRVPLRVDPGRRADHLVVRLLQRLAEENSHRNRGFEPTWHHPYQHGAACVLDGLDRHDLEPGIRVDGWSRWGEELLRRRHDGDHRDHEGRRALSTHTHSYRMTSGKHTDLSDVNRS